MHLNEGGELQQIQKEPEQSQISLTKGLLSALMISSILNLLKTFLNI